MCSAVERDETLFPSSSSVFSMLSRVSLGSSGAGFSGVRYSQSSSVVISERALASASCTVVMSASVRSCRLMLTGTPSRKWCRSNCSRASSLIPAGHGFCKQTLQIKQKQVWRFSWQLLSTSSFEFLHGLKSCFLR